MLGLRRAYIALSCAAAALVGCDKELSLDWSVEIDPAVDMIAVRIESSIEPGTCAAPTAAPVYLVENIRVEVEPPDRLPEGTYAFRARAVSNDCIVISEQCVDVVLSGDDLSTAEVTLILGPGAPGAALCPAAECIAGGCPPPDAGAPTDAGGTDAGSCVTDPAPSCLDDMARTCVLGVPTLTDCPVGCGDGACLSLLPRLLPISVCMNVGGMRTLSGTLDTDMGCDEVMTPPGQAVELCVVRGSEVVVEGPLEVFGPRPLALVGRVVRVNAPMQLAGRGERSGPPPPGMVDRGMPPGSGGAGHATPGGTGGGDPGVPGAMYGSCDMEPFEGGSQSSGAQGGGAVYIVGCERVEISAVIDAGGAGGGIGQEGGGSGGTIFVEAGEVVLRRTGNLSAQGGGGGSLVPGEDGRTDGVASRGGIGGGNRGGAGGVDENPPPAATGAAGGGGAAGFIRVDSYRGALQGQLNGVVCESPGIQAVAL